MKYRLICLDVDGTLLDDDKRIPLPVKECLRRARLEGIEIALISGRMPAALRLVEDELGFACIKACIAGTYILDGDSCIGGEYLRAADMRTIYRETAQKHQIPLWIFREEDWLVTGMDGFIRKEEKTIRHRAQPANAETLADRWEREHTGPNKLLFAADAETIRRLRTEIRSLGLADVSCACSADAFLEIFPRGMTKGKALSVICRAKGIPQNETIAFGDQELDIPMIEAAGLGVAMGNGIAALKEKADFVTATNNEGGIAYALERCLRQEKR